MVLNLHSITSNSHLLTYCRGYVQDGRNPHLLEIRSLHCPPFANLKLELLARSIIHHRQAPRTPGSLGAVSAETVKASSMGVGQEFADFK